MIYRECENQKCFFCAYSAPLAATNDMVCSKMGIVDESSLCKKFKYDPQKKIPRRKPRLKADKFSPESFEL